jgi:hypothetical protein
MWREIVFLSAVMALALHCPALAQQADSPGDSKQLPLHEYLQLQVIGGRIEVASREGGHSRTLAAGTPQSPYRQLLHLQVRVPSVCVHYEAVDPAGRFSLHLCEKGNLVLEKISIDPAAAPSIRYRQPARGSVTLSIDGSPPRELSAPSLWHLLLTERELCREHLVPLLESLRPDWRLVQQAADVEDALFALARASDVRGDEKRWRELVVQLASDDFRARQSADLQLRQAGQAAIAFLRGLDQKELSAEQRRRIDGICQAYADSRADVPMRVAQWLVSDRELWIRLLTHPQEEQRAAAADHLSRLVGRPIAFDPRSDERTRQLQVAEIARRFGRR